MTPDNDIFFYTKKKKGPLRLVETPYPELEGPLADTHAHLDMLDNVPLALARGAFYNISFICNMVDVCEDPNTGYDNLETWCDKAQDILPELLTFGSEGERDQQGGRVTDENGDSRGDEHNRIPRIRVAIGCHPHNAKDYSLEAEELLIKRAADFRTCAIGEVGLDYHYDLSPRDVQREVFRRQIRVAHVTQLPLILHIRDAHEEALQIMEEEGFPAAGVVLHCFNRDWKTAQPWIDKGCHVALGGAFTFKACEDTREAVKQIPTALLLTETDAPYMAPVPMRGMKCEPAHTLFTAASMAKTCGHEPGPERKAFLSQLYLNATGLFDRKPSAWQQAVEENPTLLSEAIAQLEAKPLMVQTAQVDSIQEAKL